MARDKGKGKRKISLQPEPEDWCFYCKDGGQLLVCDHRNCGKVFHAECVGKDDSFFDNVKSLFCGWHVCYNCNKTPRFYCISCPNAICKKCSSACEFTLVRGLRGLCVDCLEVVKIIEQNLKHDTDGKKISLEDTDTYEALFKAYWENVIKVKEGLTSDEISAALPPKPNHRKGENSVLHTSCSKSEDASQSNHRKGKNSVLHTSCSKSEDASKSNSNEDHRDDKQRPTKRKRYSSTDKHIGDQTCMESKLSGSMKKPLKKKGDLLPKPSCFASINVSNMHLIYLKQSLLLELSQKQPDSFVSKVVGTFVRAKILDSNDPKQRRKSYQLVRVSGVVTDEISHEILLQVSSTPEAIPISELSDEYFKKDECYELRQKVETNLLPKLTVEEVQEKAAILHKDIIKHWIPWRIKYLQLLIERANCSGRMNEKSARLQEKEKLEKPAKVKELLRRVPSVTPEFIEATDDDSDEDDSKTSS